MMSDPLKVVRRITGQKTPDRSRDLPGYIIRDVKRVVGITVTVESYGHPQEPTGTYTAWLDSPEMCTPGVRKALKTKQQVTAHLTKINNRWEVLEFHIPVMEKLTVQDEHYELLEQQEEYMLYSDY